MKLGALAITLGLAAFAGAPVQAVSSSARPAAPPVKAAGPALSLEEDREAAALFSLTRVRELRLTLTPEAWKAMQPAEPRFGFGGRGRNRQGDRGGERGAAEGGAESGAAAPAAAPRRASSRGGLAGRMGLEFPEVRATVTFAGRTYPDVGLRYKGNGTWLDSRGSLKRPLKLDFNAFVKGQSFHGVTTLNLHNNVTDPSFMREPLAYMLHREAGLPAPRTGYARVYLTVPGEHEERYLGLYSMVEQVDEAFSRRHFGTETGLLLKPDFTVGLPYFGEEWSAYEMPYRPRMKGERAARERFIALAKLLKDGDARAFEQQIGDYVDLDRFTRFLAVTVLLANMDSVLVMGQNYYVYLPSGQTRFLWMPWDLDRAFGNFLSGPEQLTQLSIRKPHSSENAFVERLLAIPAVDRLYRKHLAEINDTLFKPERLGATIASVGRVIRPSVAAESPEMLKLFDLSLSGEEAREPEMSATAAGVVGPGGRRVFGGRRPRPAHLHRFVIRRHESVREQLAGRSEGTPTRARNFLGGNRRPGGRPPESAAPAPSPTAAAPPTPP